MRVRIEDHFLHPPAGSAAKLILAKRAAGRPKDLVALPELEAIQEAQVIANDSEHEAEN